MALPFAANGMQSDFLHEPYQDPALRVALMGLDGYANRVAEVMCDCKKARITGVISGTPSKIKNWQSKYNIPEKNCYKYENFDAIKNNKDIDAVYIVTHNTLHHPQCFRLAQTGKQVICGKSMAINAREAQEMVDACKKST